MRHEGAHEGEWQMKNENNEAMNNIILYVRN